MQGANVVLDAVLTRRKGKESGEPQLESRRVEEVSNAVERHRLLLKNCLYGERSGLPSAKRR